MARATNACAWVWGLHRAAVNCQEYESWMLLVVSYWVLRASEGGGALSQAQHHGFHTQSTPYPPNR